MSPQIVWLSFSLLMSSFTAWFLLCRFRKQVVSVVVPSVAVAAASYKHGDTVAISGSILVDGQPAASEAVTVTVTDPSGNPTDVPNVATGGDGAFAASYQVPPTETPGTYTVSAAARGQTATATFTRNLQNTTKI